MNYDNRCTSNDAGFATMDLQTLFTLGLMDQEDLTLIGISFQSVVRITPNGDVWDGELSWADIHYLK